LERPQSSAEPNQKKPASRGNNPGREDRGIESAIPQRYARSRKDHPSRAEQPTKHQQKQIHTLILTLRGGAN
jgi:hypothetical protein